MSGLDRDGGQGSISAEGRGAGGEGGVVGRARWGPGR
jgi:hypothetical protein